MALCENKKLSTVYFNLRYTNPKSCLKTKNKQNLEKNKRQTNSKICLETPQLK